MDILAVPLACCLLQGAQTQIPSRFAAGAVVALTALLAILHLLYCRGLAAHLRSEGVVIVD